MEWHIIHLKEIDSTNKYCYKLGKEGKRNLIVVSDVQTGGVGRLEREWYSDFGGLYFSILLDLKEFKKKCKNENIGKLNFLGSLSTLETLIYYSKNNYKNLGIKFPNDVIVNVDNKDKKVSGVLSEININYGFLVLGVGINVNNKIHDEIKDTATSLKVLEGKEFDRFEILDRFVDNFRNNYFLDDDEVLKKYKKHSKTIGRYVKIITPKEEIKGKVLDIDYNGVYLAIDNEIKHIAVGDCFHLR
nr:biotin--[acetyl-CoA-carboxylase] ligase [Methanothermococcus sp.]